MAKKKIITKKDATRRRVAKKRTVAAARSVVRVTFKGSPHRPYDYFVPKGMRAEAGDFAVVKSPLSGVVLTNVIDVLTESAPNKAGKDVLDIVSCAPLRAARRKEARRQEIHLTLGAMLRDQSDTAKYASLARKPEAKALMRELEMLGD